MKFILFCLTFCSMILLSGCLYPDELKKENQVPPDEYVSLVQGAIDRYEQKTGVLPIKNSTMDTPIYEKYKIDFRRMKEAHFLSTVPANAFENGGSSIYVLVHAETKPTVKLLDLRSYQQVGDLQKQVDDYRRNHDGQLPAGDPAAGHFYWLDFNKLGIQPPEIRSPYSRQFLNPILSDTGKVAIDYAPEIMKVVQKSGKTPDSSMDLRELLVQESFFVPVKSYPYHWLHNEPVISEK